ncbi:MAG: gluconolactonase [Isosphaeraceae bacterium]|jgi:sugar lactone lactonase YvrE/enterochelin esterase-like enzyme|nr:MAG: gluconolactonase [Isosphaeraceae bacterium]
MDAARVALLGAIITVGTAHAEDPPRGEVTQHTFASSSVFPGTTRDYWLYVPAQYDPAQPACVYVNQDGIQFNAPEVFDRLIAAGQMPITIGVFVRPGVVPALRPDALDRYNRSVEYDSLGDAYARFLLEELLPDVETKTTRDGRPIRLSKNGNDRAIGGASSGAIAAFTAAWERPDGFTRVFSAIGTYVGLRGGDEYHTWIRKFEPKPIRIFLEDGQNDLNIYGGDWWTANQQIERALRFAGYEVEHAWGTGGHDTRHATEVFPDAMRFLWRGWPEPVKAGPGSPQLREIVAPAEGWRVVGSGYQRAEAAAVDAQGRVTFRDLPNGRAFRIEPDGQITPLDGDHHPALRLAFSPAGRLYATLENDATLAVFESDQPSARLPLDSPGHDLIVAHSGSIYVTSPPRDPDGPSRIWLVRPDGSTQLVDESYGQVTGMTLSPDQSLLYVADGRSHWVTSFQIQPDGTLAHKQRFFRLHRPDTPDDAGADGLEVDADGRLYVATRLGIQVCDQAGRVNAILPLPGGAQPTNLTFGGAGFDVLYVTAGDRVFARKLKVRGAPAFQAPIKPRPPRL